MFPSMYHLTDQRMSLRPARVGGSGSKTIISAVGAYDNGLFTIIDDVASRRLLRDWSWRVGNDAVAFMTTGFGDVFFWMPDGIHFLEAQRAEVEFVDADLQWFLDEFLKRPQVVDNVLRKSRLEELVRIHRPLVYGETFILVPWPMLGGTDTPENYGIGNCGIYLDLVGQTYIKSQERP